MLDFVPLNSSAKARKSADVFTTHYKTSATSSFVSFWKRYSHFVRKQMFSHVNYWVSSSRYKIVDTSKLP